MGGGVAREGTSGVEGGHLDGARPRRPTPLISQIQDLSGRRYHSPPTRRALRKFGALSKRETWKPALHTYEVKSRGHPGSRSQLPHRQTSFFLAASPFLAQSCRNPNQPDDDEDDDHPPPPTASRDLAPLNF